jgi:hypothetical protein
LVVAHPTHTLTRGRVPDLQRHRETGRVPHNTHPPAATPPANSVSRTKPPSAAELKPTELGSKEDFQLSQAIAFLKGEPVKTSSPTVAQSDTPKPQAKPN